VTSEKEMPTIGCKSLIKRSNNKQNK